MPGFGKVKLVYTIADYTMKFELMKHAALCVSCFAAMLTNFAAL